MMGPGPHRSTGGARRPSPWWHLSVRGLTVLFGIAVLVIGAPGGDNGLSSPAVLVLLALLVPSGLLTALAQYRARAPHIASATVHTRDEMARICAENLVGGVTGGKLTALVNPEVEGKRRR